MVAVDERIAELERLLDHYRGTCDECGRDNVLLDYSPGYDGMETVCLLDRDECERLKWERIRRAGEAHRARVAAGDPMAVMVDTFSRTMLNLSRRTIERKLGSVVDWKVAPAEYASFVTSSVMGNPER